MIEYSKCDNCPHKSQDHDSRGKCLMKGCSCTSFKPKGS